MTADIYMYDNNTGVDIPLKVSSYLVELLIGNKVSELHELIPSGSKLFCVFTHLSEYDFIVPTEKDAETLREFIDFSKYNYTIGVKSSSIWYSNHAKKNIIISDSVKASSKDISTLLGIYLNLIDKDGNTIRSGINNDIYLVINDRNSKLLLRTPNYNEAVALCNRNPCCIIKTKSNGEIIYKSNYGKIAIPRKFGTTRQKVSDSNNGIARFGI